MQFCLKANGPTDPLFLQVKQETRSAFSLYLKSPPGIKDSASPKVSEHIAGELLARGHACSGDSCVLHGYAGVGPKIVRAIRDFAAQYADQTEADYERFIAAIKRGRIKVAQE